MLGATTATAVGIAVGLFVTAAQARMAEFTETAIGCPSEDGMIAVYKAATENSPDFQTVQGVVEHYECEWIDKGVKLPMISQNPLISVVVRPHVFGKDVWYYVPTHSVRTAP